MCDQCRRVARLNPDVRPPHQTRGLMPNGRSGGFSIRKSDLQRLLNGLTDHAIVGQTLAALISARRLSVPAAGIDAVILTELLSTFRPEKVWVEEQDHAYYIIHLDL